MNEKRETAADWRERKKWAIEPKPYNFIIRFLFHHHHSEWSSSSSMNKFIYNVVINIISTNRIEIDNLMIEWMSECLVGCYLQHSHTLLNNNIPLVDLSNSCVCISSSTETFLYSGQPCCCWVFYMWKKKEKESEREFFHLKIWYFFSKWEIQYTNSDHHHLDEN